jgi:hypothetical protein
MKKINGTLGGGNLYSGRMAVLKGSAFLNLRDSDQSEISESFFRDIRRAGIVQKKFNA